MSHFAVMVIGKDVEKQLQPFHEFECTGIDDQYVQDIDKTDELREAYKKDKQKCLRSPEGKLVNYYNNQFYRNPTPAEEESQHVFNKGQKVHFIPEGWVEVEVPVCEMMTEAEFAADNYGDEIIVTSQDQIDKKGKNKYGHILVDGGTVCRYIDRTNPNKKWDWYQVGGRWSGMLLVRGQEKNSAIKKNIKVGLMRGKEEEECRKHYAEFAAIAKGRTWEPWDSVIKRFPENKIDEAREFYGSQAVIEDLRKDREFCFDNNDQYLRSLDSLVKEARDSAIVTFALLKDGKWFERGEMGWWGIVLNEQDRDVWNAQFNKMFDELPDDTLITIVDCHI